MNPALLLATCTTCRERPMIELRKAGRAVGNPFDGEWLRWDVVEAEEEEERESMGA